jgi:hypothetical protein
MKNQLIFDHEKLDVYQLELEFIRCAIALLPEVRSAARPHREVCNQHRARRAPETGRGAVTTVVLVPPSRPRPRSFAEISRTTDEDENEEETGLR